jgi:hypothetical protein
MVVRIPGVIDHTSVVPFDIDDDGAIEFIMVVSNYLQIVALDGTIISRRAFVESPELFDTLVTDVTDDGRPELFVPWRDARNLHISQLDWLLQPMHIYTYPGKNVSEHRQRCGGTFIETNNVRPLCAGNLVNNARKELVASVHTAYARKPREVFCKELGTGKALWRWPYAPALRDCTLVYNPRTGRNLLLFGSGAVCNDTVQDDGTSDSYSYLFALDAETGTTVWRHECGSDFSSVKFVPVDCNHDGVYEILAYVEAADYQRQIIGLPLYGKVMLFDLDGRVLAQRKFAHGVIHAVPMADYVIGRDVVLVAVRGEGLQVLDENFKPLGVTAFTNRTADPIALTVVGTMNTRFGEYLAVYAREYRSIVSSIGRIDGKKSLTKTRNMRIVLLDPRTLLVRHEIPLARVIVHDHEPQVKVTIRDMDHDGGDDLLVQMPDHVAVYTLAPAAAGTE